MKEYCLVPKSTAEKFLRESPQQSSGATQKQEKKKLVVTNIPASQRKKKNKEVKSLPREASKKKKRKTQPQRDAMIENIDLPPTALKRPHLISSTSKSFSPEAKPTIDHAIDVRIKGVPDRQYVKAMLSLMRNTPGVSWDINGNLYEPIRNFNIIDILKTLSDGKDKKGFSADDVPFIKMLFHSANLDSSFVRSNKAKKQLFGGGIQIRPRPRPPPMFATAQARTMPWEGY